jgi:ligand-binding sensor domain-containing protein
MGNEEISTKLNMSIISAIAQDSDHHFWLATRQGVSRFDLLLGNFTTLYYIRV